MDTLHALILGLIQGLTEYLPVSSSGHLEIGKALLGGSAADGGLTFDIIVHVATVLSTIVVLWKEIAWIFKGLFKGKLNDETRYVINIIISMIPVGIVGLLFKEQVEALYEGHALTVTGVCLLVTAVLLALTHFYKPKEKEHISPSNAFVIGIGCIAWSVTKRIDNRHRTAIRQQPQKPCAILVPYGNTAHTRRGHTGMQGYYKCQYWQ